MGFVPPTAHGHISLAERDQAETHAPQGCAVFSTACFAGVTCEGSAALFIMLFEPGVLAQSLKLGPSEHNSNRVQDVSLALSSCQDTLTQPTVWRWLPAALIAQRLQGHIPALSPTLNAFYLAACPGRHKPYWQLLTLLAGRTVKSKSEVGHQI
jgi:hypothetical protein